MNTIKKLPANIQNDLLQVNECLKYILNEIDTDGDPLERLGCIKEWAIEALKKLPVNNNDLVTKYS